MNTEMLNNKSRNIDAKRIIVRDVRKGINKKLIKDTNKLIKQLLAELK